MRSLRQVRAAAVRRLLGASLLLLFAPLCAGNENFKEFRSSAGPGLESGLLALLDGDDGAVDTIVSSIVQGLFEIIEPDSAAGR